MAKLQLLVRLTPETELKFHICEEPRWFKPDHDGRGRVYALTPPLAADEVFFMRSQIEVMRGRLNWVWKKFAWPSAVVWLVRRRLGLAYPGYPVEVPESIYEQWRLDEEQRLELLSELKLLLDGRLLPDNLLEQALRASGWWPADIRRVLDWGLRMGVIECFPGVTKTSWGEARCMRCNSSVTEVRPCPFCGRPDCPICTTCDSLGPVRGCTRLWVLDKPERAGPLVPADDFQQLPKLHLDFELTPAQRRASSELVDFIHSDKKKVLVWAACGAGKTEVTFAAIQTALSRGSKVLFAIPRRDVVRELAERLRKAFPDTEIAVHYGGQPWQQQGQLTIATTHQALRFYRCFDLVVLDEVDAFPYHGSEMLRFAIKRSLTADGKLVEMTATPRSLRTSAVITIPARYHGWPLPEPRFLKIKLPELNQLADKGLPEQVVSIIESNQSPWLIFAPTVQAVKQLTKVLAAVLNRRVCGSWAADPQRDQKIADFASGEYQVMAATSIMERGITLADVQVMVLYSDHVLFDSNSLIQMAGRAGRKAEHPDGEVWFIGGRITDAMKTAQKRITYLNRQAAEQGLLKGVESR